MNEINAAQRKRVAAQELAEADKIKIVTAAEAEGFDRDDYVIDPVLTDAGEDGGLFGFRFQHRTSVGVIGKRLG